MPTEKYTKSYEILQGSLALIIEYSTDLKSPHARCTLRMDDQKPISAKLLAEVQTQIEERFSNGGGTTRIENGALIFESTHAINPTTYKEVDASSLPIGISEYPVCTVAEYAANLLQEKISQREYNITVTGPTSKSTFNTQITLQCVKNDPQCVISIPLPLQQDDTNKNQPKHAMSILNALQNIMKKDLAFYNSATKKLSLEHHHGAAKLRIHSNANELKAIYDLLSAELEKMELHGHAAGHVQKLQRSQKPQLDADMQTEIATILHQHFGGTSPDALKSARTALGNLFEKGPNKEGRSRE